MAGATDLARGDLDAFLGDPRRSDAPMSYRSVVDADEQGVLPPDGVVALREWGLPAHLVPAGLGGRLVGFDDLFAVLRAVSRRDLTVTVAYGSVAISTFPVYIWGTAEQKEWVAAQVLAGNLASIAVSEEDHGSDLMRNECRAERTASGYSISGTMWPMGNPQRGSFVTVLARTRERDGPRALSLFLVDKAGRDGQIQVLPRTRTLGLRGHDVGGLGFASCVVDESDLVGPEGDGLEEMLKTVQITRSIVPSMSLGAADTALQIAVEFALERKLYGEPMYALPVIRAEILTASVDLLICECVAMAAYRAITVAPTRLSLWSAISKYFVPVTTDRMLASLSTVLGARHYLRERLAEGLFQKIVRDHLIVAVFEGTTHINLNVIAAQLPSIVLGGVPAAGAGDPDAVRAATFTISREAPPWTPERTDLRLTTVGYDEIGAGLPDALRQLREAGGLDDSSRAELDALTELIEDEWDAYVARIESLANCGSALNTSARGFRLAADHCVFHAVASCIFVWLYNRDGGELVAGEGWLIVALDRLVGRLRPHHELSERHLASVERSLLDAIAGHGTFSLTDVAGSAVTA